MDSQAVLGTLLDAEVLVEGGDGETLRFGDRFRDRLEERREELKAAGDGDHLATIEGEVADGIPAEGLAALVETDPDFVAAYLALSEVVGNLSATDLLRVTIVLQQFRNTSPRAEGAPEPFLPVACDQIETVLALSEKSILYVWSDDCEPCELVETILEEVFADPPDDVALLSVYGPDCAEFLHYEYDVDVSPTTLYLLGDEVDVRLLGAQQPEAYAKELEVLQEY